MRRSSVSCNALAELHDSVETQVSPRKLISVCESSPCLYHGELEPTSLHLDDDEKLLLPIDKTDTSLDQYLQSIPRVASRSQELLQSASRPMNTNDEEVRYLNVLQGEMAHSTPTQADVLVSAEATTCHIVALYSTSTREPLVSLAHIDKVGYYTCLQNMVQEHVKHHHQNEGDDFGFFWEEEGNQNEESEQFVPLNDVSPGKSTIIQVEPVHNDVIDMDIHLLGGFLDADGKSQELSTSLLLSFSKLAKQFEGTIKMKICTAAISCMNSCDKTALPVGRGMGIETLTGKVFMVNSVPSHLAGPALEVRSARLFRSNVDERLQVIHHSKSNGQLCIEPFPYQHFQELDTLARLPDKTLLQLTSTSPHVEAEGFCDNLRSTLGFIKRVPSCEVFGSLCDEPLVYTRSKSSNALNEWALCTF